MLMKISHILGWSETFYVAKNDLELLTFKCYFSSDESWNYKWVQACTVYRVLNIKVGTSSMLDKHCTN